MASIASRFLVTFFFFKKKKNIFLSRLGRSLGPLVLFFEEKFPFLFYLLIFLSLFPFFPRKKFLLFFFLVFLSNMFYCWRQYQSLTVSSVVGAPWRCGVLTT